jgi:hypothetical protein
VILSVLFGKRAPRFETQEVCDFFEVQHMWEAVLTPGMPHPSQFISHDSQFNCMVTGAFPPVDFFPFLKYFPTPLASWKTYCEKTRRLQRKLYFGLLSETEERMAQGHENGCFMEQVSNPNAAWRTKNLPHHSNGSYHHRFWHDNLSLE